MRFFLFSTITLSLAFPLQAEQVTAVDLDAGLWEYSVSLSVEPAGVVHEEVQSFCLSEAQSNVTIEDLMNELNWAQCTSSNEVLLAGRGSADISCVYPEDNARGQGRLESTYTKTTYEVDATMTLVGPGGTSNSRLVSKARRIGDC